ncbi:MAG: lysophospholipid acyltransferase family protein [Nitriliruptorales bacterium]|nr:lysophospholipid acyltransferase family protein [Nitriliruptorales bacterium]
MARTPPTPTPTDWRGREPVYAALQPVVDGIARLLFRASIRGFDHLPDTGPALVVANHVSHLDPILLFNVLTRAGRRPRFLALADLWEITGLGWLLRHGHMIPVHRGEGRDASMHMVATARAAMDAGQVVVVYPEGRLPRPGQPQRPREGAGRLMLAVDVPVVPVAMAGVPPWTGGLPRLRQPVQVVVGQPLDLADLRSGEVDRDRARAASSRGLAAFDRLTNRSS